MIEKKVTILDVAKKLGVATSTVSRALQDHHSISQKTKKLVRKTVEEMNYSPNNVAASLRKGKGNTIGVIIPKVNSNFMSNCIFGIESITYPSGYNLIICQSNESYDKEVDNIKALINSQVSGILMSFSNETHNSNHLKTITSNNIPLVLFDRVDNSSDIDCIINDDNQISKNVIDHLTEKGYKNIAFICGPTNLSVYKDRLNGFKDGMSKNDLKIRKHWVFEGIKTKEEANSIIINLFNNNNNNECPDAIFCTSDTLALGAIAALKEKNINIPDKVGVVGYSNDTFSEIINPSLTSIEQFPQEIGSNAAKILINIIESENVDHAKKSIVIKSKLILRDSSSR
jgi:DNA-binding LacI/PurR family transcriptional regulator